MDLYDSIIKRKSIRNYSEKKLPSEKLREIRKYIDDLDSLFEEIEKEIIIVNREEIDEAVSGLIGNFGKVEAPYYTVVSSEEKNNYLENIGYQLEFLVLKLTDMNIGTCWLGSHFNENDLKNILEVKKNWKIPVIIAFGYPEEKNAFRDHPSQANRKKLSEIIINNTEKITEEWRTILNAARLAPSAINRQPWRFEIFDKGVHVYLDKKGGIVQRLAKRFGNLEEMNHIDVGIALNHIKVATEHVSKEVEFRKISAEKKDLEYITSIFEI